MQKINFTNGHHLDINTMEYIQDAYSDPIEALAKATHLQNYIISGMEITENGVIVTVADGWVVLDGEPMEFRGGSYNGNDENPECYVVKRTETAYNLNANGQSVAAFTKTYATLAADENGAVSIYTLNKHRIRNFVSVGGTAGAITLGEGVRLVINDAEALSFGFQGVDEAVPRFLVKGNQLFLKGVFSLSVSLNHEAIVVGTIPNWEGGQISVKAIKFFYWGEGSGLYRQGIWANIQDNGNITVPNVFGDVSAIAFDCTPSLIL